MLAFQLSNENRVIEITCDDAGIDSLVRELLALKGTGSHVHLYVGRTLSETTPCGDPTVGEVIISHGGD